MLDNKESIRKNIHSHKMRMLKFISAHTRKIKISNKTIEEKLGVTLFKEKMVEYHFKWFEYFRKRFREVSVKRIDRTEYSLIAKGSRRPRKVVGQIIKQDL